MKKRSVIISFLIVTGLAIAACGKSDKASETEAAEENAELQTIEFDTGAEEPVETAQIEEPAAVEPVIEETPEVPVEEEIPETPAEPETPEETPESTESASSDYSVEDIGEKTLYTTDTVNMRKGPSSSDFEVADILSLGTQVTVNGKVNGYKGDGKTWYRIKRSDGSSVFIIADYLSDKKPEKKEETSENPDDAAKKAADDAAKKAADEAAKKAAEQEAAAPAPTPAPTPVLPAGDQPKNGHKYPDSKIAADWDRTGAISAGRKWSELDEGTKEALRIHYDDHGCSGW